ncbi:hypothetical protein H6F46_14720 [Limnothrix sp. FACHB-1083]|uniref:hypothetical protein n=1 Tax=unclassified Limnothrix TaxID=2632864 RepID=UPI00168099CA|nr:MULTISPECIES: hypothetical protein [unclassified Limnothrix]MBD2161947.1 hypothetical protein [Limnothrix sp. FACHB-1083]MBD2192840.1 hypothetical protein [Limnothrix sp. FACHB-1088]
MAGDRRRQPWRIWLSRGLLIGAIGLILSLWSLGARANSPSTCQYKERPLFGKVQIVESFPDFTVQVVEAFPDLKVQIVNAFPDRCGEWQFVNAFPDFKIKFVTAFPDFKIQFVTSFPGLT